MDHGDTTRQKISALADGELDEADITNLLLKLRNASHRSDWDLYHQIGDSLRSEEMAAPMSAAFSARLQKRLDAEPALLASQPSSWRARNTWPTAIAALAAASFGFFVAPALFKDHTNPISSEQAASKAALDAPQSMLADAGGVQNVAHSENAMDYIRLHQRSHPSLYGAAPPVRPVMLDSGY